MALHAIQRKGRSYYIWAAVFFLMLFGVLFLLYYSTKRIDYVWRWNRIPQYFFYNEQIYTKSSLEGEVESIETRGNRTHITVSGQGGHETYEIPGDRTLVYERDWVYPGDRLGYHYSWRFGILLQGLWLTLQVSVLAIAIGIVIGLFTGLARISANPALKWSAITYIELIRGSPLLVQIFIWYFVLGTLINQILSHYRLPQVTALWYGVAALAVFAGAYVAEIVRAGIQSIHRGQTEASRSLGMTYSQSMRYVILPQAFRRILPPLAGQFISLIKDSSLLGIIAIRELTKATREVVTTSLQPFELWFLCAILYLVLTFSLSMLLQYMEKRMLAA